MATPRKKPNTEKIEKLIEDGLVSSYVGTDGALVIQIDTHAHNGWLRVNLNDGPPLFNGDPELHNPPGVPFP